MSDFLFKQLGSPLTSLPKPDQQVFTSSFQPGDLTFGINKIHINNTRSPREDTVTIALAAKLGDQLIPAVFKHLGDVSNGDHEVNLSLGPFRLTDPFTPVTIAVQIINSADEEARIEGYLIDTGIAILNWTGVGSWWGELLGIFRDIFGGLFPGGCDGPVALDRVPTNPFTMAIINRVNEATSGARNGDPWFMDVVYPGLDSDWGCGSNSHYTVTYSYAWLQRLKRREHGVTNEARNPDAD